MVGPEGICPMNPWNTVAVRHTLPGVRGGDDHFSAQLGASSSGRLRFANGAHRVAIRADANMRGLYSARFGDRMPMVGVRGGTVNVRYPRPRDCDWFGRRSGCPAEVALNARVRWSIEVQGSASRLLADLRGLRLGSFDLEGGAGRVEVDLPAPTGTVTVTISGGANHIAISRPEGVPARLRVGGGATHLRFDDRSIGVAGVEVDLQCPDYDGATDRYDVLVMGGANNVTVDVADRRRAGRYGGQYEV